MFNGLTLPLWRRGKGSCPFAGLEGFWKEAKNSISPPPQDADDPSPPRMVPMIYFCAYVISEANVGSTGSTTIQTAFPQVHAGRTLT